jgi:hypothetical protein
MSKILKIFMVIALVMVMLAPGLTIAETFRQGDERILYNPLNVATKTAAYTLTSTDDLVNFTASSANLVATLPTVTSLRPSSKSFKILKTDNTAYSIIVTPGTNDTIGGESTRYLTYQNAYIVIRSGPKNSSGGYDWIVDFESPYSAEDYELGTVVNYNTQTYANTEDVTAANTITASECGKTFLLNSATEFASTLPTISGVRSGCTYDFIVKAAPSGADYTVITGNSLENKMQGSIYNGAGVQTQAAGDTVTFADGVSVIGDRLSIVSDGTWWYVTGFCGAATGCTYTQAD